jgi:hypothetical protein
MANYVTGSTTSFFAQLFTILLANVTFGVDGTGVSASCWDPDVAVWVELKNKDYWMKK